MVFWSLLTGCEEPRVLADYTVTVTPVLSANQQDAFDDVSSLDVVLYSDDAEVGRHTLSLDAPSVTGLAALEDVVVALSGQSGSDVVLWGQSSPVSMEDGSLDLRFVAGRTRSAAWLASVEKGLQSGAMVALGDGRFLIAGGAENRAAGGTFTGTSVSDELYLVDLTTPTTDGADIALVEVGALPTPLTGHTMTLMPDGRVLLIGGADATVLSFSGTSTNSASFYDPTDGSWTETDTLKNGRAEHVAVGRPDGRVVVWGGMETESEFQTIGLVRTMEVFDSNEGQFMSFDDGDFPDLAGLGDLHSRAVDLGDWGVLLCGGLYFEGSAYDWALSDACVRVAFSADAVTVSATASLPMPLVGFSLTALPDGRALLVGGATATGSYAYGADNDLLIDQPANITSSAYLFDPTSETWSASPVAALTGGRRAGHEAALLPDGTVLIAGGADGFSMYLGTSSAYYTCPEIYDGSRFYTPAGCIEGGATGMASAGMLPMIAADPVYGALVVGGFSAPDQVGGGVSLFLTER